MHSIPVNCVSSGKKNAHLRIKIGLGELYLNGSKTVLQNPVLGTSYIIKPQSASTLSAAIVTVEGILQLCYKRFLNSVSQKAAVHSVTI